VERANETQVLAVYNFEFSAVTISTIFWNEKLHRSRCECLDIEVTDPDQKEDVDIASFNLHVQVLTYLDY